MSGSREVNGSFIRVHGVCNCGKWGEAPAGFHQLKHVMKCSCGKLMYAHYGDPREAAYQEKDRISNIQLVKGQKP